MNYKRERARVCDGCVSNHVKLLLCLQNSAWLVKVCVYRILVTRPDSDPYSFDHLVPVWGFGKRSREKIVWVKP